MYIPNEFSLGQIVYLKTDPLQEPRMIGAITINLSNGVLYKLLCGSFESWHWAQEISRESVLKEEWQAERIAE